MASQSHLDVNLSGARTRWTLIEIMVPVALGFLCLALTFDAGYTAYLDDEPRFLAAMREHKLAFFPGYLGFLRTAGLLTGLLSPAASLQFISAVFGSLSVVFFWCLLRRTAVAPFLVAMSTLAFGTSVYHLFNASVGTTYTIEECAFLAVGYFCWLGRERPQWLYAAAVSLVIAGLFRQTTPVFLIPLLLYCCRHARDYKPAAVAAAGSLIWIVPTVMYFGSTGQTVAAGAAQISDAVVPSTMFASLKGAAANWLRFAVYLIYGAHLMLFFALRRLSAFDLLWIGPATLFYAAFYVAWPGYILGVLAVLYLLGVRTITADFTLPVATFFLAVICLINGVQFFAMRPIARPRSTASAVVNTYAFQYSQEGIRKKYQMRLRDVLSRIGSE